MLQSIGFSSLDELVKSTVPSNILSSKPLNLAPALTESEALSKIKSMADKNKIIAILKEADPANANKYEDIKNCK